MLFDSPYAFEPLAELVEETETRDPRRAPAHSFQYVDIGSVCNQRFQINAAKDIEGSKAPSRARKVIRENDVIFATTRPYLKSIAAVPQSLDNQICSTGFCVLRAGNRILPEWMYYFATSDEFIRQITPLMRGANYPAVTDKDVRAARIPVPPLDVQRRIVARINSCMERVEEIETLRNQSMIEARAVLPSMLNDAFVDLGKSCPVSTLGGLAEETRYGTSKKCSTSATDTAILRIPNVAGGFVKFDNLKYCELTERELDNLRLKAGDLLFVRTNGSRELVGRCAIFEGNSDIEAAFASYLIRVRLLECKMRPHFLAFFLNSTHGRIELDQRRRTSAGQFNINSTNLRSIEVPVPPLSIQDRVLETLTSYQSSVVALQAEIEFAHAESYHLRDAILRKAFAGEL